MDNFSCFYVDHTFFSPEKIGQLYSGQLENFIAGEKSRSVLLTTCQRIEFYTTESNNFLAHLNLPYKELHGLQPIFNRLVSIVAGVKSHILGEKNIIKQVEIVKDGLADSNPFKDVFSKALEEGKICREEHSFSSKLSYEDVAINLLNDNSPLIREKELVIVGSGMLAKGFLNISSVFENYNKIHFITRAHKSLKKFLKPFDKAVACNANNLKDRFQNQYHCVVATTNMTDEYKELLWPVVNAPSCNIRAG